MNTIISRRVNVLRACCLALAVTGVAVTPAAWVRACTVPVFRYALERWPPERYEVLVFAPGEISAEKSAPMKRLQQAVEGGRAPANLLVLAVDTSKPEKMEDGVRRTWEAQKAAASKSSQPWIVLRFPSQLRIDKDVWAGPLTDETVEQLLVSPRRTELARRLLSGDSVVWLLLESGDKAKDEAAVKLLNVELKRLVKELELPAVEENDQRFISSSGPELKLVFSTLRLTRTEPQEAVLLAMLSGDAPAAPAVAAKKPGPVVVPVFGRGRALTVLTGEELRSETIEEVAAFLTGACSCTAKEQQPGIDLLISADWDGLMSGQFSLTEALPALTSPTALAEAQRFVPADTAAQVAAEAAAATAGPTLIEAVMADPLTRNLLIGTAIGLVAVLIAVAVILRRGSKAGQRP